MSPVAFQRLGVLLLLLAVAGGFGEWAREGVLIATGLAGALIILGASLAKSFAEEERWIRRSRE